MQPGLEFGWGWEDGCGVGGNCRQASQAKEGGGLGGDVVVFKGGSQG